MKEPLPQSNRRRQRLRLGLAIATALLLAYPVAGNLVLGTEAGRRLIKPRSPRVSLDWGRAWTILPGLVHVSDLSLDADNRHLEWKLRTESAHLWVNLLALPSRHFSILWARAEGFSCSFEKPLEDAPRPRRRKRPWRISLTNVRLDNLRSCETSGYRLLGPGAGGSTSIGGSIDVQLRGPVRLRRVMLDLSDVELRTAKEQIARFAHIGARLASDPFEMKQVTGRQLLRSFSGEIEIDGKTRSLGFINEFLARAPWLDLKSGPGHLESRLALDRGLLRSGSSLSFRSDSVSIQYLDYVARGSAEINGVVTGTTPTLSAAFGEFSLRQGATEQAHVVGEELKLRIDAASNDVADIPGIRVELDLPPSRVPDLTAYNRLVPDRAGVEIAGGSGTIQAHLSISTAKSWPTDPVGVAPEAGSGPDERASATLNGGRIELSSTNLAVNAGELEMSGALTVTTEIDDIDTGQRALRISRARLTIEDASVKRSGQLLRNDWRGVLDLDDGAIALARPLRGRSRLHLSMTDIYPILVFFAEERPQIETIARILKVEGISGRADLEIGDKLLTIDGLEVEGDRLKVEGRLCLGTLTRSGALHAHAFGVGLASSFNGSDRRWTVLRPRRWYEQKLTEPTCAPIGARLARPGADGG